MSLETLILEHDVFVAVCVDPGAEEDTSECETPDRQKVLIKDSLSQPVDDLSCAYCGHQISDSQQLVTCETCLLPFHLAHYRRHRLEYPCPAPFVRARTDSEDLPRLVDDDSPDFSLSLSLGSPGMRYGVGHDFKS